MLIAVGQRYVITMFNALFHFYCNAICFKNVPFIRWGSTYIPQPADCTLFAF
jgi:hypothetical protein